MNIPGLKIVITGASQGLGRAMALDLARRGARLALLDVREETLASTAGECRVPGAEVNDFLNGRVIELDGGMRI